MANITDDTEPEPARVPWTSPRPAEVPALHAKVCSWLSHPFFFKVTIDALDAGQGTIIPAARNPLEAAVILHTEEASRLQDAELYSVDQEMTAQAMAAGALLPDWSVQPDDLPAGQGFLVFDSPIGYSEATDGLIAPIVACSWGPSEHCAPPAGAVWLTFWSAPILDHLIQAGIEAGLSLAEAQHEVERSSPPLVWDDEALLCWSAGAPDIPTTPQYIPSDEVSGVIAKNRTLPWIQTVLATWLLIREPEIVEVTEQHAPRHERRRAERAGRPLPPVRVVSIHRRASSPARPAARSGRTVSVRFPVRGFWRDQPYGEGRALRKRRWIEPHWRGPEDAPVLLRSKVTVVEPPPSRAE